jgi:peptide/nickel transport system substrate-binding protein
MTDHLVAGEFEAHVGAWLEGTQIDLAPIWHSAASGEPTYNWVGYADAEVDRLLERVEELPDAAAQKPLLDRIQAIIHSEQPYTFLYESERVSALNDRVRNAEINAATPYFNLDEWRTAAP